jgi:hypothetical protein
MPMLEFFFCTAGLIFQSVNIHVTIAINEAEGTHAA